MTSPTFEYRARRLARVKKAATLVPAAADPAVGRSIQAEKRRIQPRDWTTNDATTIAAAMDVIWGRASVVTLYQADPVAIVLGDLLPDFAQQAAIDAIPRTTADPPADFAAVLTATLGGDTDLLDNLRAVAHRAWLESGMTPYPFKDVGVIMPVRIETLFDPPASAHNDDPTRWLLSVRLIPQEPSIERHDEFISKDELTEVRRFWRRTFRPGPIDGAWLDGGQVAFDALAKAVGSARAAWLLSVTTPHESGGSITVTRAPGIPTSPQANRVVGLPREVLVTGWSLDGGGREQPFDVGRLPMKASSSISERLTIRLFKSRDEASRHWLVDFEQAVTKGLAGAWLLPDGINPVNLAGLGVVGLGDADPASLLVDHINSGVLGSVPVGAATNSVAGQAAAGELPTDPIPTRPVPVGSWFDAGVARLNQRVTGPDVGNDNVGGLLGRYVGGTEGLPPFPGSGRNPATAVTSMLHRALWPALWGQWLLDFWRPQTGFDDEVSTAVVEWILGYVEPHGPLPSYRFGDQPYGILPVVSLDTWEPTAERQPSAVTDSRDEILKQASRAFSELRRLVSASLRDSGTILDADGDRFTDLTARGGSSRRFRVAELVQLSLLLDAQRVSAADQTTITDSIDAWVNDLLAQLGLPSASPQPLTSPIALSQSGDPYSALQLPLVVPTRMPHRGQGDQRENQRAVYLSEILADLLNGSPLEQIFNVEQVHDLPDSLLLRLLIHSTQTAVNWQPRHGLDEIVRDHQAASTDFAAWIDDKATDPGPLKNPATGEPIFGSRIPPTLVGPLEEALGATIDATTTRIDPWITAFAWQRLSQSTGDRSNHRLGVYGWVNGPFRGEPGPTPSGLLHTPSLDQTSAATILRDRYRNDLRTRQAGESPWAMDMTGRSIRMAGEIADDLRAGQHLFEIVGRTIEGILSENRVIDIGNPERTSPYQLVQGLRAAHPMHADAPDEHAVCNGTEALAALMAQLAVDPTKATVSTAFGSYRLSPIQCDEVIALHTALDTYSDLLIADGVFQSISRQTARAASAMDAGSGLGPPPDLAFPQTPASGYSTESVVISVLPWTAAPAGATSARLAEPSLAAYLDSRTDDWTWVVTDADDPAAPPLASISLTSLGLTPIDTLAHSPQHFVDLVLASAQLAVPVVASHGGNRVWRATKDGAVLGEVSVRELGIDPEALSRMSLVDIESAAMAFFAAVPDPAHPITLEIQAIPDDRLWTIRTASGRLLALVDGPMVGKSVAAMAALLPRDQDQVVRKAAKVPMPSVAEPTGLDAVGQLAASLAHTPATRTELAKQSDSAAFKELSARYGRVHVAITKAKTAAQKATTATGPTRAAKQCAAVVGAAAWGITPVADAPTAEVFYQMLAGRVPSDAAATALLGTIVEAFDARIAAAPDPTRLAATSSAPDDQSRQKKESGVPDGCASLARALSSLASASGRLPILAKWNAGALRALTAIDSSQRQTTLDADWLTVVAPVRDPLARLEAMQLRGIGLSAWTSSPGDPWMTDAVTTNAGIRMSSSMATIATPKLAVAYGPADAWSGTTVAAGVIDDFTESVPMSQRNTYAAFGFNAPAAQAQQAILLAVPSSERTRLDVGEVARILTELRQSVIVRTATSANLQPWSALTFSMWLAQTGPTAVHLEPRPLFP